MQHLTENILAIVFIGSTGILLIVAASILLYARHQKRLLTQFEEMRKREADHQKELLSATIQSQESERKRIGQDLHDDVGAALSGLRFAIDLYDPSEDPASSYPKHVTFCKTLIDKIISDVRHISHHLSPATLNFKGLQAALESFFHLYNQSRKIRITFDNRARASTLEALPIQSATAIYRVMEELLNNTIKHAGATDVTVEFSEEPNQLVIVYSDNGCGLPADQPEIKRGIGFYSLESRLSMINSTFRIGNAHPSGFSITIRCPIG